MKYTHEELVKFAKNYGLTSEIAITAFCAGFKSAERAVKEDIGKEIAELLKGE